MYGHSETVEQLLDAGADVNITNNENDTALHTACANGNEKSARLLLQDKETSIEKKGGRGETCLMKACRYGHLQMVRALLAKNANVNAEDENGETALITSASRAG